MSKPEFLALVDKYLAGLTSAEEEELLITYYNSFQHSDKWDTSVLGSPRDLEEKMLRRLNQSIKENQEPGEKVYDINRWQGLIKWMRPAAAAIIILLVSAGIYLLVRPQRKIEAGGDDIVSQHANDVLPGGNKATLTLANGSVIILDTAGNGTLSQQGNTRVLKLNSGQLAYNTLNEKPTEVLFNTVSTPRGGQYVITLCDGTRVWLNASSSLHFPTAFVGNERVVQSTGEVYFEVARDASRPFKVEVNGMQVQVLGTHFNINAYKDEANIKTTLLEGIVKISKNGTATLLKPGQQGQLNPDGQIILNKDVDLDEVMAWKDGKFQFGEAADIGTIMRQISRWYDIAVEYRGTVTNHIGGSISRNVNVSKVFNMLELTGAVKFQVEGKKVIVMPR